MTSELSCLSIAQIRKRFLNRRPTPRTLVQLEQDQRRGVRSVYEVLKRRAAEEKEERRRISRLQLLERGLWKQGFASVAGVDEAGIGPLAGPVVAAAVVFEPRVRILGIDDSKKLTPELREELVGLIRARAAGIGIGIAAVEEIDALNIYHAGLLAMRRAVESLPFQPDFILCDARTIPEIVPPQDGIKGGDARCFSVAAASIVAKTHRDALMDQLDREYPHYGFVRHKGYSTPEHKQALRQHGPSPVHRRSFLYIGEVCGDCSPLFYSYVSELYQADSVPALLGLEERWELAAGEFSEYEQRKFHQRLVRRKKRLETESGRVGHG